jgi:hypothetical protein
MFVEVLGFIALIYHLLQCVGDSAELKHLLSETEISQEVETQVGSSESES